MFGLFDKMLHYKHPYSLKGTLVMGLGEWNEELKKSLNDVMMKNVIFKRLLDDMKSFCERRKKSVEYVCAKYEDCVFGK
jgi:lipoate synthase